MNIEKESSTDGAPKAPKTYPHAFRPKSNNVWAQAENFPSPGVVSMGGKTLFVHDYE